MASILFRTNAVDTDAVDNEDLAEAVIRAGGADAFLQLRVFDSASLRHTQKLAERCESLRKDLDESPAARNAHNALVSTARTGLIDARERLDEINSRASALLSENERRVQTLKSMLSSFDSLSIARKQLSAVEKCRTIADAYASALLALNTHPTNGSLADIQSVGANIEALIDKVEHVRRSNKRNGGALFSEQPETNTRIVASIEKRAVDAVIKARSVFVNVLDNEFRRFGWPMKVPNPQKDAEVIKSINFYVSQLSHLQRVANDGGYIAEATKWHRALSDSWGVAAILRAPLARFKYHFLERFRSDVNAPESDTGGTSRFDRPEWAAEFALERIRETAPFLSQIDIDGPHPADVKFAEGFCRVFADKIAYDCELALRTSTTDADADVLIAHASETAKQFDAKLLSGSLSFRKKERGLAPSFLSSLHILSINESFLTTWASSELRLADTKVNEVFKRILPSRPSDPGTEVLPMAEVSREELENMCIDIVAHIGAASRKCRYLQSGERVSTFLKLTEVPLLHALRSRLREEVQMIDFDAITEQSMTRSTRAAFCALLLSDALEDRGLDHFYVSQEERLGRGFYEHDVTRLRSLHSSTCSLLSDAIVSSFIGRVRAEYGSETRFGEILTADAAVVLTHDLSTSLVDPLTSLEKSLSAIRQGIPCRKTASMIWRPIAAKLDEFFYVEVVLQCFVGGRRNVIAAASSQNNFLTPDHSARMSRQVAFDTSTFVSTFSVVTENPAQFLPYSAECSDIMRIASSKVLLSGVPAREEQEELIESLVMLAQSEDETFNLKAKNLLESRFRVIHLCSRDALELAAICGLRSAIRLM